MSTVSYDYEQIHWREVTNLDGPVFDNPYGRPITANDYIRYVFRLHDDISGIQIIDRANPPGRVTVRLTTGNGSTHDAAISQVIEEALMEDELRQVNLVIHVEPISEQGREMLRELRAYIAQIRENANPGEKP